MRCLVKQTEPLKHHGAFVTPGPLEHSARAAKAVVLEEFEKPQTSAESQSLVMLGVSEDLRSRHFFVAWFEELI